MTSVQTTELCRTHGAVVPIEHRGRHWCPKCDKPTKPRRQYQRLTDRQIRAAHVIYDTRGLSLRKLGQLLYRQHGYATPQSAASALHTGFKRLGLPLRDRMTAVQIGNTTHGQARRGAVTPEYTRKRNALRPYARRKCAAVRLRNPRKGEPCQRWATTGSAYCQGHNPTHQEANHG